MPDSEIWEMLLRMVGACILGGAIGYQREKTGHPAGLRTHILVSVGATLFTITSILFSRGSDPSRIASNIVTGIGFLGAGTIIRQGYTVRGLTTAASLWTVAAIGMCIGAGGQLYFLAIVATLLVLIVLGSVDVLEARISRKDYYKGLSVAVRHRDEDTAELIKKLGELGVDLIGVTLEEDGEGKYVARMRLRIPGELDINSVSQAISASGVGVGFDWE